MSKEELSKKLKRLQEELSSQDTIDEDTKENLIMLMDDIETLLNEDPKGDRNSLIASLQKTVDEIEEEYPRITMAIQEILTTLSNMGI
ncbi:MAG: DUF4404 family protein [Nitrospinae bacterium]|nr:DUF4404 family protein [Nitrospinota bacterium]